MTNIQCEKGCCSLCTVEYSLDKTTFVYTTRRFKAGIFIYDPNTEKVLLIQSKGNLWGAPKGTISGNGETPVQCAIREVKEETGLDISESQFLKTTNIKNNATYFYVEIPECPVEIQTHVIDNDANGIGWIKTSCLEKCVEDGVIDINHHFCIIYWKFLGKKIERNKTL